MPYKNPEDKRRWEREHREERNARRRAERVGTPIPEVGKSKPAAAFANRAQEGILRAAVTLIVFTIIIGIRLLTGRVGTSGKGGGAGGTSSAM